MSISDKTRRSLRDIGVTEYESVAYLFLLSSGPSTASRISRSTTLPYSKIYDVLTSLENKGWIEVESGRPKRYFAKSPSEALEATQLQIERSLINNVNQILDELKPLYGGRGLQEKPDILILRGKFNILAKIKEYFNEAKRELMVAAAVIPKPLLEFLSSDVFLHFKDAGINVKILVTARVDSKSLRELGRFGELKVKEQMFGNGIIVDGRKVMLLVGGDWGF